jgi:hypothetical protein
MNGCASTSQTSTSQSKESMLVAAGFKTITPKNATQKQKLQNLPAGKIAMIKKAGKTYYVYPDAPNNQAYVGGRWSIRHTSNNARLTRWRKRTSKPQ